MRGTASIPVLLSVATAAFADPSTSPTPPAQNSPAPSATSTITLISGESLQGTIVSRTDSVVIDHLLLGRLTIAPDKVRSIDGVTIGPPAPQPATPQPAAPPQAPLTPAQASIDFDVKLGLSAPSVSPPAPVTLLERKPVNEPSFFDGWKGTLEGGFNGADGNSNRASYRLNLAGKRDTPEMVTSLNLGWWYTRADDRETQDRTTYEARNEWSLTPKSPCRIYVASTGEFDAFQDFDFRVSGNAGLAWNFISDKQLSASVRAGIGGTQVFGGLSSDSSADAFPGFDLSYKVTDKSTLTASFDAVVNLESAGSFRSVLRAAFEVLLDAKSNMGVKFGIEDRYDNTAILGRERHDLEYFVLLTLRF